MNHGNRIMKKNSFWMGSLIILSIVIWNKSYSQTMTVCQGTIFYRSPKLSNPVNPKQPDQGIHMISASHTWNILNRDPFRIKGWVEVYVTNGRGHSEKGPYWVTIKDFKCGKFMGT